MNNNILNEASRRELIAKSKSADSYAPSNQMYGKNRFERRVRSKLATSVKQYNSIDMNKLFKNNILTVTVGVKGETDDYDVKISFGQFLDKLHEQIERTGQFNQRAITRALINAFNTDDVYIHCSCPDWNYRFSYWSKVNDISSDPDIEQTDNGMRIVNPDDTKGSGCKHSLLVLNNTSWIIKVSSVIYNYVNYMEKHYQKLYADIIYPAIYEQEYEEPVQLDIDTMNDDELASDTDTIDTSNKYAKTKNQFKKDNEYRFRPDNKTSDKQISFDDLEAEEEPEAEA